MKISPDKLGYTLASKHRGRILLALENNSKTPTQLGAELSLVSEQVSRTLKELQSRGLVYCLNEQARKGRLYCLTREGKKIVLSIK